LREDIKLPKPPEGLEYRHLGTMEHNVCDILAQRMKHRKMSWSIKGANNLSKILAEKASRRIYPLISELCSDVISTEKLEKIVETITLSASQVYRSNKKSKILDKIIDIIKYKLHPPLLSPHFTKKTISPIN